MKFASLLDFLIVAASLAFNSIKFSLLSAKSQAGPRVTTNVITESSGTTKLSKFTLCKLLNEIPIPFLKFLPPVAW